EEICRRALDAAAEAIAGLDRLSAARAEAGKPIAAVDLALHLGEVLYGNVGAVDRLDFTVIGPAVNEVARIETLCEPLGRKVQVSRWGNSLGLRIPKDIAIRAGLREGSRVDIETEGDRIIIAPARPRYVLAELLKGITPEAMREAFDWGPDKGREIVE